MSEDQNLSALESLRLSAAQAYYSISRALRLDKVAALLQRAELSPDEPVYLLGHLYDPTTASTQADKSKVTSQLARHFHSTPWMTYRTGFSPIHLSGDASLRSDSGWGCTLRVSQMLIAQALIRHVCGTEWRWPHDDATAPDDEYKHYKDHEDEGDDTDAAQRTDDGNQGSDTRHQGPPDDLAAVLRLFWDVPLSSSTFSLHSLCVHGARVHPGRWLGPWTACCALESAAKHAPSAMGFFVRVLAGSGGGAPLLYKGGFIADFDNDMKTKKKGLILFVPLLLGLSGKLNDVYIPQLQSILTIPQSIGIIGGRPGSSLYFLGYQGNVMMYLDPHQVQPAACSDSDWMSFRCDVLKTMQIDSIDPSLALGFYCADQDEYRELCDALQRLESLYSSTPLVCVREGSGSNDVMEGIVYEDWASDSETTSTAPDDKEENLETRESCKSEGWDLL